MVNQFEWLLAMLDDDMVHAVTFFLMPSWGPVIEKIVYWVYWLTFKIL